MWMGVSEKMAMIGWIPPRVPSSITASIFIYVAIQINSQLTEISCELTE